MSPRHILADENRGQLARFASLPTLFAFDFDGTLAPFVEDPTLAHMRPMTARRLAALAQRRPCAVVTGRSHADVKTRLAGAALVGLIGNHGIEPLRVDQAVAMAGVRDSIAGKLSALEGVFIEDKTYSLTVHYRRAPDARAARAVIGDVLASVAGIRVVGGELVVNVLPAGAPHKGDALLALMDKTVLGAAIYVGDDETDEDVFRLIGPPDILTVRVGYSTTTRAAYALEHQREIDALLDVLLACVA